MVDKKAAGIGAVLVLGGLALLATRKAKAEEPPTPPEPPPEPPPEKASLYGRVTDALTGEPVAGVGVSLDGMEALTDTSGDYLFWGIGPGAYRLEFSKDGYSSAVFSDIVLVEGDNVHHVQLEPIMATLFGKVTDADTGLPLKGVRVSINGMVTLTDASGNYSFILDPGSYVIQFSKENYETLEM